MWYRILLFVVFVSICDSPYSQIIILRKCYRQIILFYFIFFFELTFDSHLIEKYTSGYLHVTVYQLILSYLNLYNLYYHEYISESNLYYLVFLRNYIFQMFSGRVVHWKHGVAYDFRHFPVNFGVPFRELIRKLFLI